MIKKKYLQKKEKTGCTVSFDNNSTPGENKVQEFGQKKRRIKKIKVEEKGLELVYKVGHYPT